MKNLFILTFILLSLNTFSQDLALVDKHEHSIFEIEHKENIKNAQTVYVCTGEYAYAYHSRNNCPGLNNCKGDIKYTDEYNAKQNLGRKPCCRCWSNVVNNCKEDNPSYGSGGNSSNDEAMAYAAIAVVALSAVVLSNDLYVYPTYSLHNNTKNGFGWSFGFRKTFNHSALEYGASVITSKYDYNYNGNFYGVHNNEIFGWHFNYIHHIFDNKTADWLTPYVGPSINYFNDFGYGGVIGTKMRLLDRLDFDIRYEHTTETSRIQAGLIFTYQRKYFWNK
jgi:hypothetical protein